MLKIGIYGGTFNPPHKEHILLCKNAIKELSLDKMLVIPTSVSPHKQSSKVASGIDRLNMLRVAFSKDSQVEVSDYEIVKQGVSYTYQTIEHFSSVYKDSEIYFFVGSDMLENFPTWKNPEYIASKVNMVLCERKGDNIDTKTIISVYEKLYNKKVKVLNFAGDKISSTNIRIKTKLNLDISQDTSEEVASYIKENNLYAPDKYYLEVLNRLTEKRIKHTYGVIILAIKLAKMVGVDTQKAELASLLHDIAKYENYLDYPNFKVDSSVPKDVIHQFLGEYICREKLAVNDEEVLNAIKYHTTGRANMSLLEKIVFVSDLIEEGRTFNGVEELRKAVFEDFNAGFNLCIKEIYKFLLRDKKDVYYLTKEAYEYYCK